MIIRVAGPGDILGLNAALNDLPYEVTAQTLEPSQLIGVRRGDLLWLLETFPEVGRKAAQVLANQYRELFLDTRRLALSGSASGRLARLLLDWAAPATDSKLSPSFTMVFTHEELANIVGTSRETVTRLLNQFVRNHIVERQGASLVILDPTRLDEACSIASFASWPRRDLRGYRVHRPGRRLCLLEPATYHASSSLNFDRLRWCGFGHGDLQDPAC